MDALKLTCSSCGKPAFSWNENTGIGMCIDCIKWLNKISQHYVLDCPAPPKKSFMPLWAAIFILGIIALLVVFALLSFLTI